MVTVAVLLGLVCTALAVEAFIVRARVSALQVRVHVGGTRGKSSVVRYISAVLRQHGYRVLGKVTGEVPTLLLPDGTTSRIHRRGGPRVQEQVNILHLTRRHSCDALVLECMSLNPLLQVLESRLLRPTISVLTNVLDDHREEFGSAPREQAEAVCAFLPHRATLVSNERCWADVVDARARREQTRVIRPDDLPSRWVAALPPGIHADNIGLALTVCGELGIDRESALAAILQEIQRMEKSVYTLDLAGARVQFLNGFAVNDVPSAMRFVAYWRNHLLHRGSIAIILNTRADRPLRSLQFARWCGSLPDLERVAITGTHRQLTRRVLREHGVETRKINVWSPRDARDPVRSLERMQLSTGCLVVGVGNIAGDGFAILEGIQRWS